ncbi:hypothetical protein [Flavobacterium microcysteis]|uniref:DUF4013 domain-containing protein n=1 Tax=Flavobacterium microcysteis TaxID=2596891 RepID=A0A501QN37_9FLAO|nr:hypothetical protein [Flavobacterium microcysteis]TPD73577.1 hypothetical protein FJA49_00670 [Flavobacterium microcysteis]
MIALFKKRNFNDYLNDTFSFFKKDGKHFIKNYFVINGIFLLLLVVFIYFLSKIYFEAIFSTLDQTNPGYNFVEELFNENLGGFIASLIGFVVLSLFLTLLNFAYPIIYLDKYDQFQGSNFDTREIISGLKAKMGKIFLFFIISLFVIIPAIAILFTVLILLSFIIIGIPLIMITIPTIFSLITLMFYDYLTTENGYFTSLGNAAGYLKKQFWPIVGVTMLMYMIIQVVLTLFSMIPYVIAMVMLFTSIGDRTTGPSQDALSTFGVLMSVVFVTVILANYILNNLLIVNQGMIYYSRKEHDENKATFGEIDSIGTNFE